MLSPPHNEPAANDDDDYTFTATDLEEGVEVPAIIAAAHTLDVYVEEDLTKEETSEELLWTLPSKRGLFIKLSVIAAILGSIACAAYLFGSSQQAKSLSSGNFSPQYLLRIDYIGNNGKPTNSFPLSECMGDCDNNEECSSGLICYQRNGKNEAVPGCLGGEDDDGTSDYCIPAPDETITPGVDNIGENVTLFPTPVDIGEAVTLFPTQGPGPTTSSNSTMKPIKVYILMGQSNMLGFGRIEPDETGQEEGSLSHAVKEKGLYPYLMDEDGNWSVRNDVRNVQVMGSGLGEMQSLVNDWLTIDSQSNRLLIGPEIGIGHYMGQVTTSEPVLLLKSCIGNRALGWDLLPPGSKGYEFTDSKNVTWVHPGYGGSPERWRKGTTPDYKATSTWYAGKQYDGDIARAKKVLSELDTYYPGAGKYDIAGFFWWQGDRDSRSEALSSHYETNLVQLIKQLRKDFNAPRANFVCASLGQTKKDDVGNEREILDAMLAVDGRFSSSYPEFKGNVAAVYSHPLSKGGSSGNHYYGHAESFMNIGEAMGCAMVQLQLNSTQTCSQLTSEVSESPSLSPSLKPTYVPTIIVSSESSSPQPSYTASEEPPEKDIV